MADSEAAKFWPSRAAQNLVTIGGSEDRLPLLPGFKSGSLRPGPLFLLGCSAVLSNLVVTRMDGPDASDASTENPSWAEIESAIRSLDGKRRTLIILGVGDPTPHMGIGGGGDGKYIVYVTPDNLTFDTLIHPDAPPGKCLLVAGGQLGDYENRICTSEKQGPIHAQMRAF